MTVEQDAINFVVLYEKKQGREAKIVKREGYDLLSGNRRIEVKGIGKRNNFVLLNAHNIKAFQKEDNWWLYIVYDVKTNPKLINYSKLEVLKKLQFEFLGVFPLRKADWEKGGIK